jgi:hypothetical protein
MSIPADEAAAALSAMRTSRENLAAAATCPPLRHLVFAGLMGGLVASQAAPVVATIAIEVAIMAGVAAVVAWDRRRTGMFINGYRAGPTRPLTFALLIFALGALALCDWLKLARGVAWAPLAGGVVVAAVAYAASTVWQRIYLRELRAAP